MRGASFSVYSRRLISICVRLFAVGRQRWKARGLKDETVLQWLTWSPPALLPLNVSSVFFYHFSSCHRHCRNNNTNVTIVQHCYKVALPSLPPSLTSRQPVHSELVPMFVRKPCYNRRISCCLPIILYPDAGVILAQILTS